MRIELPGPERAAAIAMDRRRPPIPRECRSLPAGRADTSRRTG